jgi:DnaJ family protein C protein 28
MPNIEEHLRRAMAEGKFDDLPGKGKPLNLREDNPHADPEWELAFRILKEGGYSLPWIETIREIERELENARQDLQRAWEWYQARSTVSGRLSDIPAEWKRAQDAFKESLNGLNNRIRDYNLQVPQVRFQRPLLNYEKEVRKITNL